MREFILKGFQPNQENIKLSEVKFHEGAFSLHHVEDAVFKLRQYDADGKIENTLFFTYEQVKCLYLLLSKEV